jgi:hypothetical protein
MHACVCQRSAIDSQPPVALSIPHNVVHRVVLTSSPVRVDHSQCRALGDAQPLGQVLQGARGCA